MPVKFVGVGEQAADLLPFDARAFAHDAAWRGDVPPTAASRPVLDTPVTFLKGVGPNARRGVPAAGRR